VGDGDGNDNGFSTNRNICMVKNTVTTVNTRSRVGTWIRR